MLQPLVDEVPWVYRDSHAVRRVLKALPISLTTVCAKYDLKDFCLSGTDFGIATAISQEFRNPRLRDLMFKAIYFLLSNQFVVSKTLQSVYQCIAGSGIGLRHSSSVANYLFYLLVERDLIPSSGLLCWIRYHDDVLCFSECRYLLRSFASKLKQAASSVFRVLCESVHSTDEQSCMFTFLDLDIKLCTPSVIIECSQHKAVIPLCADSAHSLAVHRSWPGAVCNRTVALSDSGSQALQLLRFRYRQANAHPDVLRRFEDWQPGEIQQQTRLHFKGRHIIMVLRYHPVIRCAFCRALRLVPFPSDYGVTVQPAWSNDLPSVAGVVESSNSKLCQRVFGKEGSACVRLNNTSAESRHTFTFRSLLHEFHGINL